MTRAGLGLALIIAVYAALLFADLIGQAVNQLRSHIPARSQDVEATDREIIGPRAKAVSDFVHLNSPPRLTRVRKVPV